MEDLIKLWTILKFHGEADNQMNISIYSEDEPK